MGGNLGCRRNELYVFAMSRLSTGKAASIAHPAGGWAFNSRRKSPHIVKSGLAPTQVFENHNLLDLYGGPNLRHHPAVTGAVVFKHLHKDEN
jgi:hypothetical protein